MSHTEALETYLGHTEALETYPAHTEALVVVDRNDIDAVAAESRLGRACHAPLRRGLTSSTQRRAV